MSGCPMIHVEEVAGVLMAVTFLAKVFQALSSSRGTTVPTADHSKEMARGSTRVPAEL